jgi:AbrB family looped-hinge helix DNA binding protein
MTTLTSKGQVTIPKAIRETLGIGPGSEVAFKLGDDGEIRLVAVKERNPQTLKPDRFAKMLGIAGPGPTTDELMALLRGED